MAFVCVNRKLCALHDAFSAPDAPQSAFFDVGPAPDDAVRHQSDSQTALRRLHGVSSEHAHGAFYVFLVATVFNLNASLFSAQKGRSRLNLQVAYISAVAAFTHFEMWLGRDWFVTVNAFADVVADDAESGGGEIPGGVSFSALRVLEWVFTTPVLLLLVQHLHEYAFAELPSKESREAKPRVETESVKHTNANVSESAESGARTETRARKRSASAYAYVPVNKFLLIAADEAMIACGVLMPVFPYGAERFALLCVSMACFCFVIAHSVFAIVDIMLHAEIDAADGCRLFAIAALKVIAWSGYPLVYFLTEYGVLTVKQQHEFYLYNDVLTKFSYSLMISAGSLRCLDLVEEHKQKIATQMSQAQRAFFFNVTHELRTPLNSIIGFNTLAMESGELTDFTNAFIKASLTSAEALLGLINQILDFAKFEGAKDANGANGASAIELSEDVWTVRQLMEQVTDMTQKATSACDAEPGPPAARPPSSASMLENAANVSSDPNDVTPSNAFETNGDVTLAKRDKKEKKSPERRPDIVVTLATPEHFNTAFVGDFFRLRQCCVNLVDNAVKYSTGVVGRDALVELVVTVSDEPRSAPPAKATPRARSRRNSSDASAEEEDDDSADFFDFAIPRRARITFEVRDNGVGIPAAKQHALFVPFCQPAEHRAAKEKGTGLGLVITKSIVECMGGEIDFVSVEDVGTRFFFTVSFQRADRLGERTKYSYSREKRGVGSGTKATAEKSRGSVDAVLDAGKTGGLGGGSDGSEPSGSDGDEISSGDTSLPTNPFVGRSADDVLPAAAKIVVHPSMRGATRRHAVNILRCFRALPGLNYAVCKTQADVEPKLAQAKRLGAPVVFVEASEDADASAALVEAAASPSSPNRAGSESQCARRRVSFENDDANMSAKSAFERGVVVFGRPKQLMELRKRLGHREDVACVFEPAKPSEVLRATRRLTETLLTEKARGSEARGSESRGSEAASRIANLEGAPRVSSENENLDSRTKDALRGMSVLLVEDNLMNQQMVKHSVVKCGVALDVAGDGAEAVALVEARLGESRVYDAILMDMMMPVKDGATATREIRAYERELAKSGFFADGKRKRHVIIGLSANVGPAFVTEVRAAGMDGAVSKPFYPATLRRALLEVRTGAYRGFKETEVRGENRENRENREQQRTEVRGSIAAGGGDDATGGFVEDAFGDDAKRVEGTRSSAA